MVYCLIGMICLLIGFLTGYILNWKMVKKALHEIGLEPVISVTDVTSDFYNQEKERTEKDISNFYKD